MLKVIELFAGIGSQTQALKNIDVKHEVTAISEIDKYALKSYGALHGAANNLGDIREIKGLPPADLWTYSFLCQDISVSLWRLTLSNNLYIQAKIKKITGSSPKTCT